MKTKTNKKGFTLIEVLVVTTIIAVLTAIGMVSYASASKRGRDTKRKADLAQIQAALEMFRTDGTGYPVFTDADLSGNNLGLVSSYIAEMPKDPKNDATHKYYYTGTLYTYCLSANIEDTSSTCTVCAGHTGYNYCVKNP